MSFPELDPKQTTPAIVLPRTGSHNNVSNSLPFGVYGEVSSPQYSEAFVSGAVDQVSFTYKRLGGDVIDIELTEENVYAAYEEAVLEYSNIINMHQAKNSLENSLGSTTGSFDEDGIIQSGSLSSSLGGQGAELKFPKFQFTYERRIGQGLSSRIGVGGDKTLYSASVNAQQNVQDYDLRTAVQNSSTFTGSIDGKQIVVTKVYYQTPRAAWRFYGYYGGMNVVGNLHNYGQYSDDSTFELIPTWQNKLQAIAYEDAIYTRLSHFSYEIHNNKLRIYPSPDSVGPDFIWFKFYIPEDPWSSEHSKSIGLDGVNNVNTLPFQNIPYENINSMGKQWIRNYALAICKEMLGQIRGKYNPIPIPNENVTLNADDLLSQAKEEKEQLRTNLEEKLDELTYEAISERKKNIVENKKELDKSTPLPIYQF